MCQGENTTPQVYRRPLLIVPPQVNKFYVIDLSPSKSMIRYLVANGMQVFAISWRNPTPKQREWGFETYDQVILEAIEPYSFSWFARISVYTGLPDVLGWPDHVAEQRYNEQVLSRMADVGIIYSTPDPNQANQLLRYYSVRYIYVGELERQAYAAQSTGGLDKFERMVGSALRIVYRHDGVTIYEVL